MDEDPKTTKTTTEPQPLALYDQFDAAGWTGAARRDDYFDRGRRSFIGPSMMIVVIIALAADSWMFRLSVALPILAAFAYYLIAYQRDHLQIRITRELVTFSFAPMWLPPTTTLPIGQLRGFEVVEFNAWVTASRRRFEAPLWEVIAVAGNHVRSPLHVALIFRQPRPAKELAERLNWVLSRVREG